MAFFYNFLDQLREDVYDSEVQDRLSLALFMIILEMIWTCFFFLVQIIMLFPYLNLAIYGTEEEAT